MEKMKKKVVEEREIYEFNNIALSDDVVSLGFYLLTLWSDF